MHGRFQSQKFNAYLFTKYINISNIYQRNEEEQFTELEEFYNMTNRDVFKKYGILAEKDYDKMLLSNSVLIDSLLKGRYDEVDTIWCGCVDGNHYKIIINMNDGTEITAGDTDQFRGITIGKDGKKARVVYDPIEKTQNAEFIDDIDNLSIDNVVYTGDLELMEQLRSAIQEQFETKVKAEEATVQYETDKAQEIVGDSTYTSEDIELLTRQIVTKKIQSILDGLKNGNNNVQPISIEEFELLNTMLYERIDGENIGYTSSDNTVNIPNWHMPIPARQYSIIQLPEGKRICAEFLAHENSGTIKIKDIDIMVEPEDEGDFISVKKSIDGQQLIDSFGEYSTDESLKQLLTRKLQLQERELASLEKTQKTIDEAEALIDQQKEGQDIGEE